MGVICAVLAFMSVPTGCKRQPVDKPGTAPIENTATRQEENSMKEQAAMTLTIGQADFTVIPADTEAARELAARLPLDLDMTELNGNEKYAGLDRPLPQRAENVRHIEAGDVMLWGDDCLVVFYKSFDTPYSYTRIGRIADARSLARAVGKGNVPVRLGLAKTTE